MQVNITLAIVSLGLIIASVVLFTKSYFKLKGGLYKSTWGWTILALYFMAFPYTVFILRDVQYLIGHSEKISMIVYASMCVVALLLLKASVMAYHFAKRYGFAGKKIGK